MPPADEVWSESGWEEAVWFADEADFLWALCCWRGPREDQTEHWQDAEVQNNLLYSLYFTIKRENSTKKF